MPKVKLYEPFMKWYHGGTIWLYSDPHFQKDTEMEQFFKWPPAEERLARINKCVTKNDTFVCLGDVGDRLDLISKIKCDYKVLITGNHDKGNINYKRVKDFPIVYVDTFEEGQSILKTKTYVGGTFSNPKTYKIPDKYFDLNVRLLSDCMRWEVFADNHLFDEIYDGPLFISDKILLSHERIDLPFCINIHGHEHCAESWFDLVGIQTVIGMVQTASFNIASDVVGFKPIRLDEIISKYPLKNVPNIHRITIDNASRKEVKDAWILMDT